MTASPKCHICGRRTVDPVLLFDGLVVLCRRDAPDAIPNTENAEALLVVLSLNHLHKLTDRQVALLTTLAAPILHKPTVRKYASEVAALRRAGLVRSKGPLCRLTPLGEQLARLVAA